MTESAPPRESPVPAAAGPEPAEDVVPEGLIAEFSSLTTPYCWVITEDPVAGYDGAEPSAVGAFGPDGADPADRCEALEAGRFFRLAGRDGGVLAIGRIYDPSGDSEQAPLADFGRRGAAHIEYRAEGRWQRPG